MSEHLASWQQALAQGQAEESLKHYRQTQSDPATLDFLESLISVQSLLREKNALQAQRALSQHQPPEWANALHRDITAQLSVLVEVQRHLEKHEADNMLALLPAVQHPLLLGEAETLRGIALIYYNDTQQAKEAFEKALSYDPRHYRAITNMGNIALENKQLEEAIALYEKALKLNENFSNAHHNLAVAYKRKGEVGKSVRALKQAQRISQQKIREEARGVFKSPQVTKYVRWAFFAGLGLIIYLFVRNQL